ncbi:MAG TPA: putative sulfate exporter family transporter [Verrucomicrobiae bacterium]|nr:putative sulfate exporter family transporter [Verrucomicrobiae bacterium]
MSQSKNDYAWAEFLDYMEGLDLDVLSVRQAKPAKAATIPQHPVWGLTAAILVTLAALWLGNLDFWPFSMHTANGKIMHPIEPVMIAIILGMIISNVWKLPGVLQPGIKFSVKKVLPLAIVLLGVRLNFGDLVKLGLTGLALSCLTTVIALVLLLWLARLMKLPHKLGLLLGVGTAICGGSAIVATAPVIEAEEGDVAFSLATVTVLGLLGMFFLPLIGHALDLGSKQFGIWAAMCIHQIPQVIAAGYSYSPANADYSTVAGDTATIAKLARVCLLAPMVFLLGLMHARNKTRGQKATGQKINYFKLFPMFLFGFMAMALLKTLGLIPDITFHSSQVFGPGDHPWSLSNAAEQMSKFCIAVSMAGVGLETKFSAMRQTGLKPFVASLIAVLVVAVLVLALIKVLGV